MAITKSRRGPKHGSKHGSKSRSLSKRKNNGTKCRVKRSKASRTRKNRSQQRGGVGRAGAIKRPKAGPAYNLPPRYTPNATNNNLPPSYNNATIGGPVPLQPLAASAPPASRQPLQASAPPAPEPGSYHGPLNPVPEFTMRSRMAPPRNKNTDSKIAFVFDFDLTVNLLHTGGTKFDSRYVQFPNLFSRLGDNPDDGVYMRNLKYKLQSMADNGLVFINSRGHFHELINVFRGGEYGGVIDIGENGLKKSNAMNKVNRPFSLSEEYIYGASVNDSRHNDHKLKVIGGHKEDGAWAETKRKYNEFIIAQLMEKDFGPNDYVIFFDDAKPNVAQVPLIKTSPNSPTIIGVTQCDEKERKLKPQSRCANYTARIVEDILTDSGKTIAHLHTLKPNSGAFVPYYGNIKVAVYLNQYGRSSGVAAGNNRPMQEYIDKKTFEQENIMNDAIKEFTDTYSSDLNNSNRIVGKPNDPQVRIYILNLKNKYIELSKKIPSDYRNAFLIKYTDIVSQLARKYKVDMSNLYTTSMPSPASSGPVKPIEPTHASLYNTFNLSSTA